jgi:DNA polymerase-1
VNAAALLVERLREAGVSVGFREDRAVVRARPGALTPDLRAQIVEHRDALRDLLREPGTPGDTGFTVVRTSAALSALATEVREAGRAGVALLATGPDAHLHYPRALAVVVPGVGVHVVDIGEAGGLGPVAVALCDATIVGHDLKSILLHLTLSLDVIPAGLFDTLIASKLADGGAKLADDAYFAFAVTCERLLGCKPPAPPAPLAEGLPLTSAIAADLAASVAPLLGLEDALRVELHARDLTAVANLEHAVLLAVVEMQNNGIPVNPARWANVLASWRSEREALQDSLRGALGIDNVNNPDAVLAALRRMGLDIDRTKKKDLAPYAHVPAVKQLIRYRHLNGFVTAAGPGVQMALQRCGTRRVRPVLNPLSSASGRFSARESNLLALPRERAVRDCVQPERGMLLVVADYAAIELRVLADLIQESRLLAVFRTQGDPHRLTASALMNVPEDQVTDDQRQAAKAVNFGFAFGQGAKSFVAYALETYGVTLTLEQALSFRDRFLATYPGIAAWHSEMKRAMPHELRTAEGRLRYFGPDDYCARLNHIVQGSAADGMKRALVLLHGNHRLRQLGARLLLVIHDEVLVEAPAAAALAAKEIVVACMRQGISEVVKSVPIVVEAEVRPSWAKVDKTLNAGVVPVGHSPVVVRRQENPLQAKARADAAVLEQLERLPTEQPQEWSRARIKAVLHRRVRVPER